jgi:DNA repair exonuclease SbcCD ATPase subunit
MIQFKSIEWSNLLSTGNVPNRIQLDSHNTTLIIGKNGNGKSTVLDALTFVLFGKSFRSISKNQLINSINGKNTKVSVEFDTNGSSYKVIRGIKPNIFEIYKNEELLTQDAALKDYQLILEQQILKMNYRAFTQVVILGSSSFVPFMQLSTGNRREVIEDILDIRIFSTMNSLLKEKIQTTKRELELVDNTINRSKSEIESQKSIIKNLETSKNKHVDSIRTRIDSNITEINDTNESISKIESEVDSLVMSISDANTLTEVISHAKSLLRTHTHNNDLLDKTIKFFDNNENCPQCSQEIPHEHKFSIKDNLVLEYEMNKSEIESITSEITSYVQRQKEIEQIDNKIRQLRNEIYTYNSKLEILTSQNRSLQSDIDNLQLDKGDIDKEKLKLKELANIAMENVKQKTSLQERRNIEDISSILLKDTGIKSAVIREYLPVMNTLINKYLSAMDFYVKFELDETFSETIKSRHRDDFTYSSFSEGEKNRIDLALLFAWREIAKLKNSANTNLLLLDEVLDGSLDVNGTDFIINLLTQLGDICNVFVISHNIDQIVDKFDRVLTVEKRNDFSVII